ncbi:hypothetical protein K435DRAFT_794644 [Dendrothele bispora CBS 962.96]|uniref:Uncharacterized protein n=1 Tax=Dendrothele bispora (strain CBS 962.96) TaxID=1314807 RepID=A0A4S8MCW4_DENBC|nr:hypothetical protein K435DRAFT_794644 [Dendrothele bispora CBS 962.96]
MHLLSIVELGFLLITTFIPFVCGGNVWIRNQNPAKIEAMISNYNNASGDPSWFLLPPNYTLNDPPQSLWMRYPGGWDLVAFKNQINSDDDRVGFYQDLLPDTIYITFYSFTYVTFDTDNPEA